MKSLQTIPSQPPALLALHTIEDDERRSSRHLLLLIGLIVAIALWWAATFQIEEVTRGVGKVIPASREQVVQSLDAGILSDMRVREGDRVEKGQVLLRIDDARSGSFYRETREKWMALTAQAARLRAEANNTAPQFPTVIATGSALAQRELHIYQTRRQALEEQVQAMQQAQSELDREIRITEPLVEQHVLSEVELLRLKRQRSDMQASLVERKNRYWTEATTELAKVESELAQTREATSAREDAFRRTIIRSPMDGIVKNVQISTLGAVIPSGQNILEIVPVDDRMLVEAYVKPSEIAFLALQQPVTVKLSAYDFNRYGALEGVLEHLSPDTLRDENKPRKPGAAPVDLEEGYYRVLVRIVDNRIERHGRRLMALPGMTATVDIRTGQKTVLEYLLRPLQTMTQALRER